MRKIFEGSSTIEIVMIIAAMLFGFCGIVMIIGMGLHSKTIEGIGLFGLAASFLVVGFVMAIDQKPRGQ